MQLVEQDKQAATFDASFNTPANSPEVPRHILKLQIDIAKIRFPAATLKVTTQDAAYVSAGNYDKPEDLDDDENRASKRRHITDNFKV